MYNHSMKVIELAIFDLSEVLFSGLIASFEEISKVTKKKIDKDTFNKVLLEDLFLDKINENKFLVEAIKRNNWNAKITRLKKNYKKKF